MYGGTAMADVELIGPDEAWEHVESGALLVCAYDSDEKFQENHLERALSLSEFGVAPGYDLQGSGDHLLLPLTARRIVCQVGSKV
jgi:hypothetical protein